jgi:hypothetical protein
MIKISATRCQSFYVFSDEKQIYIMKTGLTINFQSMKCSLTIKHTIVNFLGTGLDAALHQDMAGNENFNFMNKKPHLINVRVLWIQA